MFWNKPTKVVKQAVKEGFQRGLLYDEMWSGLVREADCSKIKGKTADYLDRLLYQLGE